MQNGMQNETWLGYKRLLSNFEYEIKIKFNDFNLLRRALTHRSYVTDHPDSEHNERLEYLGDAVLGLAVAEYLYREYPDMEGGLTRFRDVLVSNNILTGTARQLGIEKYLRLGCTTTRDELANRDNILADAFEALIGAIYLDLGLGAVAKFIKSHLTVRMPELIEKGLLHNINKNQKEMREGVNITSFHELIEEPSAIYDFEKEMKIEFNDLNLLNQALTHPSYLNEHPDSGLAHYGRQKFLGEAVLGLITTEHLYKNYPDMEGDLTYLHNALVNHGMRAEVAKQLGIEKYLRAGDSVAKNTERTRNSVLADAFEALTGAIYLDQGYDATAKFIESHLVARLPEIIEKGLWLDPKHEFQKEVHKKVGVEPVYEIIEELGPANERHFIVGAYLGSELIAKGEGEGRQEAEKNAAEEGLKVIKGWNKKKRKKIRKKIRQAQSAGINA